MFTIRNAHGEMGLYHLTPFQDAWHRLVYLVNPELAGRLRVKGRGLGATMSTMIDLIMLATV